MVTLLWGSFYYCNMDIKGTFLKYKRDGVYYQNEIVNLLLNPTLSQFD